MSCTNAKHLVVLVGLDAAFELLDCSGRVGAPLGRARPAHFLVVVLLYGQEGACGANTHELSVQRGRGERRTGASVGGFTLKLLLLGTASNRDSTAGAAPLSADGVVGGDCGSEGGGSRRLESLVGGDCTSAPPPAAPPPGAAAPPPVISAEKSRWSTDTCSTHARLDVRHVSVACACTMQFAGTWRCMPLCSPHLLVDCTRYVARRHRAHAPGWLCRGRCCRRNVRRCPMSLLICPSQLRRENRSVRSTLATAALATFATLLDALEATVLSRTR